MHFVAEVAPLLERARVRRSLPAPAECRRVRLLLGLTQAEVASVVGTTRAAVSRYEAGKRRPRAEIAERYGALIHQLQEVGA